MDKYSNTRYNKAPKFLGKGRTKFDLSHNYLNTFNTGDLVVCMCEPVVPGSTFSLKTATLARLETSFHQTMDNAYLEFAYFFCPSRILWQHFDQYQGFNEDAWARTTKKYKPQLKLVNNKTKEVGGQTVEDTDYSYIKPQSLLNQLYSPVTQLPFDTGGLVANEDFNQVDLLPLRAVFKIYNEYFRDENVDSEIYYSDGDTDLVASDGFLFNGSYFYPALQSLKVNRFKDVYSTALPQPQKGDPVSISFKLPDSAPVGFFSNETTTSGAAKNVIGIKAGVSVTEDDFVQSTLGTGTGFTNEQDIVTDLSNASNGLKFTINDLRIAMALQAMRERDARGGTRLNEKLYSTWHLEVNSLELDKPEFLGGKRIPVSMMEVLQTSESGTTVLGSDAGHSKTFDSDDSFIRTFTQWGYVIGFVFVRTSRSYSQGIDRKFFVRDILDEYDPMLDNIGEMPIYKKELNAVYDGYAPNAIDKQNEVFGYQEAWYWLKERQNRFCGYFQAGISGTLDSWHYGDSYFQAFIPGPGQSGVITPTAPYLSPSWLKEGPENVNRTIAVQASPGVPLSYQWSINIHFECTNTFEAAYRSIPNKFGF